MNYYDKYLNDAYDVSVDFISCYNDDLISDGLDTVKTINKNKFLVDPFYEIIIHDIGDKIFEVVMLHLIECDVIKYYIKYIYLTVYEIDLDDNIEDLIENGSSDYFALLFSKHDKIKLNNIATMYLRKKKINKLMTNIVNKQKYLKLIDN